MLRRPPDTKMSFNTLSKVASQRPLDLGLIDATLEVYGATPESLPDTGSLLSQREIFLHLYGDNSDAYERARGFISCPDYWRIEENVFGDLVQLTLDHYSQRGQHFRDWREIPQGIPMSLLAKKYNSLQDSLKAAEEELGKAVLAHELLL